MQSKQLRAWLGELEQEDRVKLGSFEHVFLGVPVDLEVHFAASAEQRVSPRQKATLRGFLSTRERLEKRLSKALFRRYQRIFALQHASYAASGIDVDDYLPAISEVAQLAPLLTLQSMYLPRRRAVGTFGLGFWAAWDREQGLGVRIVDWKVRCIGIFDAHRRYAVGTSPAV